MVCERMANVLDWKSSEDTRDIVHILVQALVEDNLVALPAETAYHVFASALNPTAVGSLLQLCEAGRVRHPTLFLRSGEEALDYSPNMSVVAARAVSRGWPGPLVLELPANDEASVAMQLPESAREPLMLDGRFLSQRVASHEAIVAAMRLMPGPLVGAACVDSQGEAVCLGSDAAKLLDADVTLIVEDGKTHYGGFATAVRVDGNACELMTPGVLDTNTLDQIFQMIVLLVCTGNTCRSPMAEALLTDLLSKSFPDLQDQEHSIVHVASAGISAFPGGPASVEAQSVMKQRGLNLQSHQSRAVTERSLRYADAVLAMTNSHRGAIVDRMPQFEAKVRLLSGGLEDVADPFGGTEAIYAACADQIETFLGNWVQQLDRNWFPRWQ